MDILEDLFYGNISPIDKAFDRDSEYAKFIGIVADCEKKLAAFLEALPGAEEQRHLLSRMMNAQSEIIQFSVYERFVEGFRLGAGLIVETFVCPRQSVLRDIS